MLRDPVDGAFVLCVGLPISLVGDLTRLLRDHAVVMATGDTDGARALLGPPGIPAHVPLTFVGVKWMKPKGRVNTWSPSTTLYSRIERADGTTAWCGILKIGLVETLKLFRSTRPVGAADRRDGRRAVRAFNTFFAREQLALLRDG